MLTRLKRIFLILSVFAGALSFTVVTLETRSIAETLDCSSSTTLESLFDCIYEHMPKKYDGYKAPTSEQKKSLRTVYGQMLDGDTSIVLPPDISNIMRFFVFTDTDNGRTYSVLMEVEDGDNDDRVDRGFGTFIVYNGAARELNIGAPHPVFDISTGYQAIRVFKNTDARSFTLAGTHRKGSNAKSLCQSSYKKSDASHNKGIGFVQATRALMDYYGESNWHQIQFHGMGSSKCGSTDVMLSHGDYKQSLSDGDILVSFRRNLLHANPTWNIQMDGGTCYLDGGSNTSGRLINGVSYRSLCTENPENYGETFIHIEQKRGSRNARDWVDAINATF